MTSRQGQQPVVVNAGHDATTALEQWVERRDVLTFATPIL